MHNWNLAECEKLIRNQEPVELIQYREKKPVDAWRHLMMKWDR